jgi:hypothetical protein
MPGQKEVILDGVLAIAAIVYLVGYAVGIIKHRRRWREIQAQGRGLTGIKGNIGQGEF